MERIVARCDSQSMVRTEYETVETRTLFAAGDSASLTVPMTLMAMLPDGASFTKQQGSVRLSLKREGTSVVAEASTDSICQSVTRYERLARDSLRQRVKTALRESRSKSAGGGVSGLWKWLATLPLIAAGVYLALLFAMRLLRRLLEL